jgi:CheY-like chemotaxis protein
MSTLFVVDDNELDRWIVKRNADKLSLFQNVMYYADGETLMEYIAGHKNDESQLPDGILLDLRMPGYDGWKVLEALKGLYPQLSKKINVYIISATAFTQTVAKAKQYEFVKDFFLKPITPQNLISIYGALSLTA